MKFKSIDNRFGEEYSCFKDSTSNVNRILAPPKLGENEVIEIVKGKSATLSCEDSGAPNTDLKSTISWSMLGSPLPSNVQMPAESRKAFVMEVNEQNGGTYMCTVVNNAGTSQKSFQLIVLEPPQFVEKQFDQNVQVVRDTQMSLKCLVTGQPHPTITWRRDGEPIALDSGVIFSDSFQRILLDYEKIHKGDKGQSRYTCHASNQAGIVTRDFFVTTVAPPEIKDTDTKTIVEVQEGHTATLNCNVSGDDVDIQWRKQGRNILDNEATLSEDRSRLIIIDAQKEHEDVYTCTAKNQAGQVSRDFELVVLSPPRVRGPLVETLEVVEGDDLTLQCQFDGNPPPTVSWTKDGKTVPSAAQLLNENATLAINKAEAGHAGEFKCAIRNKAGAAEKTFKVHVIGKPEVDGLMDKVEEVEVIIGRPFTFACPVRGGDVGVERSWTRHALPVVNGENNLQVMADGAHLHLSAAMKEDEGTFTCIARNKAGESQKSYKLKVLVPPTITNKGGEYSVIENNSLVLPCEVEGEPNPKIEWRKDGHPINTLGNTFGILNDGQQFKINRATPKHKGSYACHASNKVGSAEINFDVDVITKPTVASGFKDQVEVVEGETALFRCPIEANNKGQITWLKDYQPIKIDGTKYTTSQDNRRLHLHNSTVKDESGYSCRIKNDAGETRADYKLVVFVPPKIVMLDKDKNRTVIENKTVTLSCPATGKPEPSITWFKDGERLDVKNISTIVATAQLIKNEIKITRVNAKDSGRFTCEAKNVAGVDEQDVVLSVMTPPKIEREGIPSDIEEVADRTVTISCPVYGKPTPTVTWLKNGRPLSDQQKIKTSANGQKLYFLKLAKDEADRYTCIAKNPAGEDKRDFNVKLLEAPSFDGPNLVRRVQTNEGRPSILTCPSSGSPPPTITWLKDGVTLAAGPRHVFLDNGRQLQISNTQVEDRARYTCIATNSVGSDDLETSLDVVSIPKISGEAHQILEVVENDRQDLHCDVNETDSGVEIEWQKAGQTIGPEQLRENTFLQLPSSGRRLHILSARVTDAGRYTCVVRNPAGEARKTFELKVYVPASINEANSSPDMQTIVPGKPITIECDVEGNPPPQVEWYHNEKKLKSAAGVRLSNNNETLTIQEATLTSGGRYTCRASNRAGNASKDFVIKMTGPPVFDQGIERLDVAAEDSIALTCIVSSGGGNLTVKWIVNGKPVENGELSSTVQIDDRTVKITKARLSDVGQYVCVATNEGGEARKTFELSVLEAPRFLDMTNRHPAIVVGRPLTLDCSTTGTPKPTILWLKVGLFTDRSVHQVV
ncbi:unnamed protein product, partial [Mesorhabditis belari]|uniref:Ig-like domain-containing protein n=1 Tax=Mesorhabditis belari TaxID=2138241 RepID=A0AAF3FK20_9BILA